MSDSIEHISPEPDDDPIDPAVTPELYKTWRSPRFGTRNPARMNNPVWEWLVKSQVNAYQANERLKGPSAMKAGPGWCFDRFGQSSTSLPDGRVVLISGEHEDSYDPDFYIYNDVVVRHPDGSLDIYGYPREVFPPTDFQSATLVGDEIVLIGNLGYPDDRRPGQTPVLVLDLQIFEMRTVQTSGTPPGWIHMHTATLSEDGRSILVERGKLDRGGDEASLVENIDDWRLHLDGWRWERLTERRWLRFEIRRQDGRTLHLFDYQQAVWAKQIPALNDPNSDLAQLRKRFEIPTLEQELGRAPDLELFSQRFKPSTAHDPMKQQEDEYSVHRIKVDGVVVRYVEEMHCIQMTVEGDLPDGLVKSLTADLLDKLAKLENAPCKLFAL